jgi:hypothetical protein
MGFRNKLGLFIFMMFIIFGWIYSERGKWDWKIAIYMSSNVISFIFRDKNGKIG